MSPDPLLSDDDKRAILSEEAAHFEAESQARRRAARQRAREIFRAEVRAAQRARPPRWGWLLAGLLLWAGAALLLVRSHGFAVPDDTSGGIASSLLIDRCERAVTGKLGQLAAEFPDAAEAADQITASPDGKRWDGWVASAPNFAGRAAFSCEYSPPTNSLVVQLME